MTIKGNKTILGFLFVAVVAFVTVMIDDYVDARKYNRYLAEQKEAEQIYSSYESSTSEEAIKNALDSLSFYNVYISHVDTLYGFEISSCWTVSPVQTNK